MAEGVWFLLLVRDYIGFVRDAGLTARLMPAEGLVIEYCDGETFRFRSDGDSLEAVRARVMAELGPLWQALRLNEGLASHSPPEGLDEAALTVYDPNWRWLVE